MGIRARASAAVCVVLASAVGCGTYAGVDDRAGAKGSESPPGFDDKGATPPGPGANGGRPQTRQEFCAGSGGIVLPGTGECAGDLARKTFRFAACSCTDLVTNGPVRTRSFDSRSGTSLATGGSLGVSGGFSSNGTADVGGSLWASGRVAFNGDAHVFQELRAGAGAGAAGSVTVDGDYYGATPVQAASSAIRGASHVPAAVAPPCDCSNPVPIDRIVSAFANDNDDAASGLTPTSLARGMGDRDLTLDCGRYYFTEITQQGGVTLRLKGRTAIFVAGDISPNGGLNVVFEGGAELDLFVVGDVALNGEGGFGDPQAPARVRVYVLGARVSVNGDARLAGNLYAPNAVVGLNGSNTTRGSVYARSLGQNGALDIEYDEAVLKVQGCAPPAGACASCRDCAGATPACKGGTCGACTSNADCCAPLMCQAGACVPSIK